MSGPHSRRWFLRSSGVALSGIIAGCNEESPSSPPEEETTNQTSTEPESETSTPAREEKQTNTLVRLHELDVRTDQNISTGHFFDIAVRDEMIVCAGSLNGSLVLVALDPRLRVQWSRVYSQWQPVEEGPELLRLSRASDGGFLLGAMPTSSRDKLGVFKTDSRGHIEWDRKYEPSSFREPLNTWLIEFGDGSYAYSMSFSGPDSAQTSVHGFDTPTGQVRWEQTYDSVSIRSMAATPDGGCLLTGNKIRTGFWMAKLDSEGTERWQYTTGDFKYNAVAGLSDGGFVLWGTEYNEGKPQGPRIRVLDEQRREEWTKTYEKLDTRLSSVAPTTDSGYLLASSEKEGVWATELASGGNMISRSQYGDAENQTVKPTEVAEIGERRVLIGEFGDNEGDDVGWILTAKN